MPNEKKQMCIPLRLNMRVQLELNKTKFIVRIVSAEDNMKPGYVCESDVAAKIYLSASEAVNKTYNNLFNNKTRYSGPSVLGFDNENITKELLSDVLFCPFKITVDKLSILIINLGNSNGDISIQNKEKVAYYHDASPTDVWKKTGILKNYNGSILFGIEHPVTINVLKNYVESPICSVNEWGDIEVMSQAFEKHLKRKISVVGLNWHKFFIEWKEQESNIIELMLHLKPLYPLDHEFTDRELRAWRKMMKNVGCTNITPYKKQELKPEFWTCSVDFNNESNALLYLFNKNLLNGVDKKEAEFIKENKRLKMIIEKFWRSFKETIKANKCGWDGKQRILSIIVENFGHREIQRNLVISNDLINAAKKFSRVNGPGSPAKVKPVESRNTLVNELEKLRHHLKRGFENELAINEDGTILHSDTINHCLLYAFGDCCTSRESSSYS
ncbi:unnamed protein product [Rhizophagus irregularis]|nr:unnamed protein product [Rhizophagus irregularis]